MSKCHFLKCPCFKSACQKVFILSWDSPRCNVTVFSSIKVSVTGSKWISTLRYCSLGKLGTLFKFKQTLHKCMTLIKIHHCKMEVFFGADIHSIGSLVNLQMFLFKNAQVENNCCVFWPANGCFASSLLVEIIFFALKHVFLSFSVTNEKRGESPKNK